MQAKTQHNKQQWSRRKSRPKKRGGGECDRRSRTKPRRFLKPLDAGCGYANRNNVTTTPHTYTRAPSLPTPCPLAPAPALWAEIPNRRPKVVRLHGKTVNRKKKHGRTKKAQSLSRGLFKNMYFKDKKYKKYTEVTKKQKKTSTKAQKGTRLTQPGPPPTTPTSPHRTEPYSSSMQGNIPGKREVLSKPPSYLRPGVSHSKVRQGLSSRLPYPRRRVLQNKTKRYLLFFRHDNQSDCRDSGGGGAAVRALPDPDLGHPLGVDGRLGGMEQPRV